MLDHARGQAVGGVTYAGITEAKRETQVVAEVSHLQARIGNLQESVQQLSARLECVTRPENTPTGNITEEPVAEVLVPVADHIRGSRQRIQDLTVTVESLLQRLEV